MKRKLGLSILIAVSLLMVVVFSGSANGPNIYWEITNNGYDAWLRSTVPIRIYEVGVTDCDGIVWGPWYHYDEPWSNVHVYAEPGDAPVAYVYAMVSYQISEGQWSEIFRVDRSRGCGARGLKVLIPEMWLLTGPDVERETEGVGYAGNACMLIAESHPSVERQNAKCFPINDPDWTATNAPCAGPVYDDGTDHGLWACDAAMKAFNPDLERLPLFSDDGRDLWHVYLQHLANSQ